MELQKRKKRPRFVLGTVVVLVLLNIGLIFSQEPPEMKEVDCQPAIGCDCMDFIMVTGVVCNNVTDFDRLTKRLSDGSLYEVNETYEITITGTPVLPQGMLKNLIVFRLFIDDIITRNVSERVFEGVIRLRRLHVRISSIEFIPDLSFIKDSLRHLNFDSSLLTSLSNEIQNLSLLEEATFRNNSIRTVSADAFLGTEIIRILDFSRNLIEFLPPTLLDNLPRLNKLSLTHNRLHTIHGLLRVARPRLIYLAFNNLTDADDIFDDNMTSAEAVSLDYNPLRKFSNISFNERIASVRFLYLNNCEIREFDADQYRNLSKLALLDLTGNLIEKIPKQTIDFGDNLQLLLDSNKITSFEAEITFTSRSLYLSDNRMRLLGTTLQLTQMHEVEVNRNQLEALLTTDFHGVHETENLSFRQNKIRQIDSYVFVSIRNDLQYLDLSINHIESLNGSIRFLSRLKSLNLAKNSITTFGEWEFTGLNELAELYLQNNKLIALSGQIQRLPQLKFLTVQNNRLTTLNVEQLPRSLRFLHYKNNPILCDCRLLPFLEWLNSPSSLETDANYCNSSLDEAVTDEQYTDSYFSYQCPQPCRCFCSKDVNDSYITMDCSGKNMSVAPAIFQIASDASSSSDTSVVSWEPTLLKQNKDSNFSIYDRVLSVNLENNHFKSLDGWSFPKDLKELRLANNDLKRIPDFVIHLPKLRTLSLSGNDWTCDCESVNMKTWLISKSDGVVDLNKTDCDSTDVKSPLAGKQLAALSDVDLCPSHVGLYVTISFCVVTLLLLIAALKITYNHYEMNIKVWLYAHGVSWVKEEDLDKDKIFDAFISFSHQDESFVISKIIAEIEQRVPDIRLCLHYRHFLPGEFIHINIMNAVSCSKRTVIVLSQNFLESEWCLLEFRTAHLQALEDKVHRLIVIKVGDLSDDIDPAIKVYLDSTTYVTWGEKYFWQKLIYALPKAQRRFSDGSTTTLM